MTTSIASHLPDKHRLDLLIGALADYAIYMLDADGFITTWNPAAERITGYKAHDIIGQHFSRFFTAEDQAARVPEKIREKCWPMISCAL